MRRKRPTVLSYSSLSLNQSPMKLGILPESSLSEAHLRSKEDENHWKYYLSSVQIILRIMSERPYTIVRLRNLANVDGISPLTPELSM